MRWVQIRKVPALTACSFLKKSIWIVTHFELIEFPASNALKSNMAANAEFQDLAASHWKQWRHFEITIKLFTIVQNADLVNPSLLIYVLPFGRWVSKYANKKLFLAHTWTRVYDLSTFIYCWTIHRSRLRSSLHNNHPIHFPERYHSPGICFGTQSCMRINRYISNQTWHTSIFCFRILFCICSLSV